MANTYVVASANKINQGTGMSPAATDILTPQHDPNRKHPLKKMQLIAHGKLFFVIEQ